MENPPSGYSRDSNVQRHCTKATKGWVLVEGKATDDKHLNPRFWVEDW